MKFPINKEQRSWGYLAFLVLAATSLLVLLLINLETVAGGVKKVLSLFVPFYVGFFIAYILNPFMKFWENKVFIKIKKPQARRTLSVLMVYTIYILVLGGVIAFLIPQLANSITKLVNGIPNYYKSFMDTALKFIEEHPSINEFYTNYKSQIDSMVGQAVKTIGDYLTTILPKLASFTVQFGSWMLNFFVGSIISLYFLVGKEKIIANCKRILNAIVRKKAHYQRALKVAHVAHEKTLHFITGQLLDALAVAILSYIAMMIFGFPYALLNSIILGLFNTIPYFGPWIGAVPPAIIILIVEPKMFFWYLLFVLVMQQIDSNIIGPRIQGQQVGLSALWIMFAIFLFGGLFGVLGMMLGVPVFAVIYYFISAAITQGLEKQGKPTEAVEYARPKDREMIEEQEEKSNNE